MKTIRFGSDKSVASASFAPQGCDKHVQRSKASMKKQFMNYLI